MQRMNIEDKLVSPGMGGALPKKKEGYSFTSSLDEVSADEAKSENLWTRLQLLDDLCPAAGTGSGDPAAQKAYIYTTAEAAKAVDIEQKLSSMVTCQDCKAPSRLLKTLFCGHTICEQCALKLEMRPAPRFCPTKTCHALQSGPPIQNLLLRQIARVLSPLVKESDEVYDIDSISEKNICNSRLAYLAQTQLAKHAAKILVLALDPNVLQAGVYIGIAPTIPRTFLNVLKKELKGSFDLEVSPSPDVLVNDWWTILVHSKPQQQLVVRHPRMMLTVTVMHNHNIVIEEVEVDLPAQPEVQQPAVVAAAKAAVEAPRLPPAASISASPAASPAAGHISAAAAPSAAAPSLQASPAASISASPAAAGLFSAAAAPAPSATPLSLQTSPAASTTASMVTGYLGHLLAAELS